MIVKNGLNISPNLAEPNSFGIEYKSIVSEKAIDGGRQILDHEKKEL